MYIWITKFCIFQTWNINFICWNGSRWHLDDIRNSTETELNSNPTQNEWRHSFSPKTNLTETIISCQFLPVLQKDKRRIKVNIVPSINQYMDLTWLIDQCENMNEMKCLNDNNDDHSLDKNQLNPQNVQGHES